MCVKHYGNQMETCDEEKGAELSKVCYQTYFKSERAVFQQQQIYFLTSTKINGPNNSNKPRITYALLFAKQNLNLNGS